VSGIVRAVHQSFTKLGDTPLARLDLFESLPSRRFGCRASTTNSTTKSRSTSLYNGGAVSRGGCRALQLYSAPERSTSLQLYSALHSTSSTPSLSLPLSDGPMYFTHPYMTHEVSGAQCLSRRLILAVFQLVFVFRLGGPTPPQRRRALSPGCQAVRCCQVICRAVGQLSGTVRCLCQTSCQVLSVLSGAVRCVSDIRGAL